MINTDRKTGSKRRVLYFRGDSRRDTDVSEEEQARRWNGAFVHYCRECSDKHGLEHGKCPKFPETCQICGNDGFMFGRLSKDDEKLHVAMAIEQDETCHAE